MRHREGRIEVICGSMFCGKTEELIRRIRRAEIAQQKVQIFKPKLDDRFSKTDVISHSGHKAEAVAIEAPNEIIDQLDDDTTVVAIDEAQFLDVSIIPIINALSEQGIRVIVAGLDMDFRGEPFGVMPQIMACAEDVTKLHAICMVCGEYASHTQRLVNGMPASYDDPIILVGAKERYEARCRKHHKVPNTPQSIHVPARINNNGHHS